MDEHKAFREMNRANPSFKKLWDLTGQHEVQFEPNVEQGLERLKKRMAAEQQGEKTSVLKPLRMDWRIWSAAAAVLLIVFAVNFLNSDQSILIQTLADEVQIHVLEDGTVVTLNQNSSLRIEENLNEVANRNVYLKGEAHFSVAPDPDRPFTIYTEKTTVEVLGTAFNLRAYPLEGETTIEVVHGSVRFSDSQDNLLLTKNMKGTCEHATKKLSDEKLSKIEFPDWYNNRSINYDSTSFFIIKEEIERRFDIQLLYDKTALSSACTLTFPIYKEETLDEILITLKEVLQCEIDRKSDTIIQLRGANCK